MSSKFYESAPFAESDRLVGEMLSDVMDELERFEGVYGDNRECGEIPRVETEYRPGFTPYTNGGWDGRACVSTNGARDGSWACMESYYASDYREMCEEFWRSARGRKDLSEDESVSLFERELEREWQLESAPGLPGVEPIYADNLPAHKWEFGWQYESDDDAFFLDVRALYYAPDNRRNETGEHEIYFFAGVNLDFEYGRDSVPWLSCYGADPNCHKVEYGRTVKFSDVTPEILEEIKSEMLAMFAAA